MKSGMCKCGHHFGEGSEHGTFSFPSACKTMPMSKGKSVFGFMGFTQRLVQSPSLFFPGKSLFQWPHSSLYVKCFCMQVWHVKILCYSCVFDSQKRVTLTAATTTYKMAWYIFKSVDCYCFCSYCIWNFIDILNT